MEPPIGFEPMTYGLQDRRSTSWAMVAQGGLYKKFINCKLSVQKIYGVTDWIRTGDMPVGISSGNGSTLKVQFCNGVTERARTSDLFLRREAFFQLNYGYIMFYTQSGFISSSRCSFSSFLISSRRSLAFSYCFFIFRSWAFVRGFGR